MKWFLIPFLLLSGTPVSAGEVSMTGSCASSVSEVEISSTGDIKVGKKLWSYSGPCGWSDPFFVTEDRKVVIQTFQTTTPMDVDMGYGVSCKYGFNDDRTEISHSCYSVKSTTFENKGMWRLN